MRSATALILLATVALSGVLVQACESEGTGGGGGAGGAGGDGNPCGLFGPQNPDECSIEGFSCVYADTGCTQRATCRSGEWEGSTQCFGTGGAGGQGGGGAGGTGGAGGAGPGGAGQGGTAGSGGTM